MADSVVESTIEEAKRHPYWIVGGVVGLVVLIYLLSGSGKAAAPQDFKFSYGPSDAQVQAGTALALGQAQNQTAVSLANIQASNQTAIAGDYYSYLATAGKTSADASVTIAAGNNATSIANTANTNATQQQIQQYAAGVDLLKNSTNAGYAYSLGLAQTASNQQIQQYAAGVDLQKSAQTTAAQTYTAALSNQLANSTLFQKATAIAAGHAWTTGT